jgi:molecular chaperone GrpE
MSEKKDTQNASEKEELTSKGHNSEEKPDSGKAKVKSGEILIFNSIQMDGFQNTNGKYKPPKKIPVRGARAGQKDVNFEIELNTEVDPMVLVVLSPELEKYNNSMNLTVNDDRLLIEIDNDTTYGFCEFELSQKIMPQFSVGSFEGGKLKLWLKKQSAAVMGENKKSEGMIWCSENILTLLEDEKQKVEENLEKFHQVQLDYQNYIVSTKREKERTQNKFASELLLNMIDVQDNIDRALEASKKTRGKNILVSGVEMIRKQMEDVLIDNGVTEIQTIGTDFDPLKHEACATEISSKMPEDTVIEVIQKGYMYKNKVLRLSKVKIAKPEKSENCE